MSSTGFNPHPTWSWPQDVRAYDAQASANRGASSIPGAFVDEPQPAQPNPDPSQCPKPVPKPAPRQRTHWPPRTCRICLETVHPTFHRASENVPGIFQAPPSVTYESTDADAGRLFRPCKCKGTSKYVHEGCLQSWRHADPGYAQRNFFQCPTCGFRYRLERMQWGRWISSTSTQIVLTISIFFVAIFLLGFIADPIINLYLEPYSMFYSNPLSTKYEAILTDDEVPTWAEHFIKGLASLGLLSFIKFLIASPWNFWNFRSTGFMGGASGRRNNGRDRLLNISWLVVAIGVGTFLWVCAQCHRTLHTKLTFLGRLQRRSSLESPNVEESGRASYGCGRWG